MSGDERASGDRLGLSASGDPDALRRILSGGDLRLLGLLEGSSNATFLAEARDGGRTALAVYKPRRGEAPLWDFPDGTLWQREIAAYELAAALGWPEVNVPMTVAGDGPHGAGAVQAFVDHDPERHFFLLRKGREAIFMAVAVFDAILNNADRKGGHTLLGADGRVWLVDHGTCFSEDPKLRTVIWDWAGEPLPDDLHARVRDAAGRLRAGSLNERMGQLLSPAEVTATVRRAEAVADEGRFPEPGMDRHVPWPPV